MSSGGRVLALDPLWAGYFIMPQPEKLNDLHGRTMVNIVSGETFHIYDKYSSRSPKPSGWLALRTMEDEINRILSRAESKFCAHSGGVCTSKTVGLLMRRHIIAGEFHFIGKRGIHALGGWSRSVYDARRGNAGPGGRNLPRVRESSRPRVLESNPDRSETVFNEAPIAQVQSSGVRNTEFQEKKEHDQVEDAPKADTGVP